MATTERTWKVGELARETGVTVRALHHFEDKGPAGAQRPHRQGRAQRYQDEGWEKPSHGMLDSGVMEYMGRVFESAPDA